MILRFFHALRHIRRSGRNMESKEQYFRETGCLQSEIILDGAGNLMVGCVSVGEKLIVGTPRGLRTVTVAEMEEYSGQVPEPPRMTIRKPRARREAA